MRRLALFVALLPSIAVAQVQIQGSAVQIGGNQPGVSSIQGQTQDFVFNGAGFSGCTTVGSTTTCTFTGGGPAGGGTFQFAPLWTPDGATLGDSHIDEITSGVTNISQTLQDNSSTAHTTAGIDINDAASPGNYILGRQIVCPNIATGDFSGCSFTIGNDAALSDGSALTIDFLNNGSAATNRGGLGFASTIATPPGGHFALQWDRNLNLYFPQVASQSCLGTDSGGKLIPGTCGGGGGSGTVNSGVIGALAYYAATGTAVSGDSSTTDDGAGNVTTKTLSTTGTVAGQGGYWNATEGTAPSAASGHDLLYADSTAHCIKQSLNGGSFACLGSGSAITSLTGDGTAAGPGAAALTLATVNSNVGSCGDATHVPQVTLNAKGLSTGCTPVSISAGTTVNVNGSSVSNPNFNGSTPAAGSNGKNVAFQVSSSSVSAEVVGDGNALHYLDGTGNYTAPGTPGFPSATLFGQVPASTGAGTTYTSQSFGMGGRTVTVATDTIVCTTTGASGDRNGQITYNSGSAIAVTVPDPSTSGCGSNLAFNVQNAGAGLVTFTRGTSSTFTTYNGSTVVSGATTFALSQGQYATISSADNTNWNVTVNQSVAGSSPASVLIGSTYLGGTAASITFTSIPATYKRLRLNCTLRTSNASNFNSAFVTLNGDTSANYETFGNQTGAAAPNNTAFYSSGLVSLTSAAGNGVITGSTSDANSFVTLDMTLGNYTASQIKVAKYVLSSQNVLSSNNLFQIVGSGFWQNTAAVTSVTITASTSATSVSATNFIAGSGCSLIGEF